MSKDSSLGGGTGFDVSNSQGVGHVLASLRASDLSPAHKNELRDLVLQYANNRDNSTKLTLEQKILSYGLAPVAQKPKATPAKQYPFGTVRPRPTIPTPSAAPAPQSKQTPEPVAEPTPAPEAASEPKPSAPAPVSSEVAPPPAAPAVTEVPPAPQPEPTPAPIPTPEPPKPVEPTPAPAAPVDYGIDPDKHLARIREIKATVNQKTGNPANLIDITNDAGREYMTALLDAMKKLNSGAAAGPAMQRLEEAFAKVEASLDAHDAEGAQAADAPEPTPAPVTTETKAPEAESTVTDSAPAAELETQIETPQADQAKPASDPTVNKVPLQNAERNLPVEPPANLPTQAPEPAPAPAPMPEPPKPVEPAPAPAPTEKVSNDSDMRWGNATPLRITEDPKSEERPEPATSVSETREQKPVDTSHTRVRSLADSGSPLHSPDELTDPASVESSSKAGDPLFTNEINEGLEQLLVEWPLFKKSGLFGTGPKGREHPLYLKIKDLQIPLLLAGRFEGANQEIKQSITDYMNGWRYEQGIIYQQGETFEHYLRRVIKRILDLHAR